MATCGKHTTLMLSRTYVMGVLTQKEGWKRVSYFDEGTYSKCEIWHFNEAGTIEIDVYPLASCNTGTPMIKVFGHFNLARRSFKERNARALYLEITTWNTANADQTMLRKWDILRVKRGIKVANYRIQLASYGRKEDKNRFTQECGLQMLEFVHP